MYTQTPRAEEVLQGYIVGKYKTNSNLKTGPAFHVFRLIPWCHETNQNRKKIGEIKDDQPPVSKIQKMKNVQKKNVYVRMCG